MSKTRFTTTGGPATLAEVCKLAWHTFYGMQKASEDFENLRFEVWTIAISLDSLHSVGTTSLLIDRQPDRARWALTFTKILTSLGSALRPLHNLVRQYLGSSSKDRASIKNWLLHPDVSYEGVTIQDFRRKLSMLVESLNVFLSCLTHAELARARDVSESEEFRVLSEVTRTVLNKWDSDLEAGVQRRTERSPQMLEVVGFVNDDVKRYMSPLMNSDPPGLGFQLPSLPSSPIHPHLNHEQQQRKQQQQKQNQPHLNLDDIEQGFRSHMHAMRRIREQLHHQTINSHHQNPAYLDVQSGAKETPWGTQPPLTPITPNLHPLTAETHPASECTGSDRSVYSTSLQSSDAGSTGSHASHHIQDDTKLTVGMPDHHHATPGHHRKRKRPSQFRFKTCLEAEHSHSSDGSDDSLDDLPAKSVLEQMLTTVLFFDQ